MEILQHWELILAVVTPIFAWVVGRKRKEAQLKRDQAEAKDVELGTIANNFKLYQDVINDLDTRFKHRIEELESDLDKMKTLNAELRKAIAGQEKYIKKLTAKIEEYEKLGK